MSLASPTPGGGTAPSGQGSADVLSVRVVVRTPTVETFVQKYCRFVKEDWIFIFTKSSQPMGTRLRFTLELVDGRPLVSGEGTVTRVREDRGDPQRPPGMELRFTPSDDASQKLFALMLAEREHMMAPATTASPAREESGPTRPTLSPLPPTGAHFAVGGSSRATVLGRSPLLTRPVVGEKTDLPRRPGSRATLIATPAVPIAGSPEAGAAALARTMTLEAPSLPAAPAAPPPFSPPVAEAEAPALPPLVAAMIAPPPAPTVETPVYSPPSLFEPAEVPIEVAAPEDTMPAMPAPTPPVSRLDADSLFAQAEVSSPPSPEPDETTEAGQPPELADELSRSFPGLAQPTEFAEGWRPEGDALGTVPANPFMQVSDTAIEYFVEWSLERSTATTSDAVKPNGTTSFGAVEMRPPSSEVEPAARRGVGLGLAIGLGVGVALGAVLVTVLHHPSKPAVAAMVTPPVPIPTPAAVTPSPVAPAPTPAAPSTPTRPPEAMQHSPAPTTPTKTAPAPTPTPAAPSVAASSVSVASTPPGASVRIDGTDRGKTPLTLALRAGKHDVVLSLERRVPFHAVVEAPGKLEAELKRPHATMVVASTPPGGTVSINGEEQGKTPVSLTVAEYETYRVAVVLPGKKPWRRTVYMKASNLKVAAQFGRVARASKAAPTLPFPGDLDGGRGIR